MPGGSAIRTQQFYCCGPGSIPGQRIKIPQAQAPAVPTEKKLEEFPVEEAQVLQILTQVNVVRRECEIVSVREGVRPQGLRVLP